MEIFSNCVLFSSVSFSTTKHPQSSEALKSLKATGGDDRDFKDVVQELERSLGNDDIIGL